MITEPKLHLPLAMSCLTTVYRVRDQAKHAGRQSPNMLRPGIMCCVFAKPALSNRDSGHLLDSLRCHSFRIPSEIHYEI